MGREAYLGLAGEAVSGAGEAVFRAVDVVTWVREGGSRARGF